MASSQSSLGLFLVFCIAFQAVAALQGQVVAYWGQASGNEKALRNYCSDSTYDILVVSFIMDFPTSRGDSEYPALNLAGHCNDEYPGHPNLLTCPDVAADIKYCQSRGKKIFISLGGADGDYGFTSTSKAEAFATVMYNTFLGGNGKVRPFGNAVIDGVDLDIEHGNAIGYAEFINKLRTYSTADKPILISGAPQCPYPDDWLGPVKGSALTAGWFDYVFVQFYNNNCGVNYYPSRFNFNTWANWAQTTSKNRNVKIMIGAPASKGAAGEGYVNAATLKTISLDMYAKYPNVFGGIMLWDAGTAADNSNFGAQLAAFLHTGSSPAVVPVPAPVQTPASATSTSGKSSTSTSGKSSTSTSSSGKTPASTPVSTPSGSCTSGNMKCASSNTYQTCNHGAWADPQSCQKGLTCSPSGQYIYCVR